MKLFSKFAVLAAMGAGSMFAGSISYTGTFGPATTDFTNSVSLQDWNPALFPGQTLTGVVVTFKVTDDISNISLTNVSGTVQNNFDVSSTSKTFFSGAPESGLWSPASPITLTLFDSGLISLGNSGGNCAVATPTITCSSVTYNPASVNGTSSYNGVNLALYQGTGTFSISGTTLAGTTFSGGGGNLQLNQTTVATFMGTVTYTYTASQAPEPATMSLFGGALLGIGFFARKRAKKA
jgi:hypothetical protein